MNGPDLSCVFLCLGTGAVLGGVFLFLKWIRLAGKIGTWGTAFLDLLFCVISAFAVFLCALASDHGRLRLYQALLHLVGAVSAVTALDPLVCLAASHTEKLLFQIGRYASKVKRKAVHVKRGRRCFKKAKKGKKMAADPKKRVENLM